MKYLKSIMLGFAQGVTEFLPVSSSGHLMLLEELGLGENSLLFNIMLHIATLLSVCIIYRKKLWSYIKKPFQREVKFLVIATAPTVVIAFFVRLFIDQVGVKLLPFGFMLTTVFLILSSMKWKKVKEMDNISAFITGIAQGIATIGGVSRSGSTISTQMMLGMDKQEAGDFTFLLSIPIIIGSGIIEALVVKGFESVDVVSLLTAMIVAFVSGLFAIKIFLRIIKKGSFFPFAVYTFILSIVSFFIVF